MIKAKKYIPVEIGQNFYGQTINLRASSIFEVKSIEACRSIFPVSVVQFPL